MHPFPETLKICSIREAKGGARPPLIALQWRTVLFYSTPRELLRITCCLPVACCHCPLSHYSRAGAARGGERRSAMQLFSGRSKEHRSGGGGSKCQAAAATTARHRSGKCRALCCGASRLSVSSSASCSSADAAPEPLRLPPPHAHPQQPRGLSKLAHVMVHARLRSMIDAAASEAARPPPAPAPRRAPDELVAERPSRGLPRAWARGGRYEKSGSREPAAGVRACVVLLAEDRRTHDPREEFRRSIAEVIAAKRMAEPAELRALLNCYVSVNAREHRAAILQAFHEVCSALFSCKQLG
ncbi:hypothetical protein C2845_PM15G09810 [Panicum miliaceum]|uniref:Transcription repressor n=1 Tax=Panicum miliaceum TaxID=4540 RepID=A0A3L6Q7S3_PANMI|nr:hypothetical protein C2845_PM15G09810 [Panicum miliaceum]